MRGRYSWWAVIELKGLSKGASCIGFGAVLTKLIEERFPKRSRIVIYKLGYKQKVTLVRHFIGDEGTKVDLELLVDAFGLAVCLRVEGSTYTTLNADMV